MVQASKESKNIVPSDKELQALGLKSGIEIHQQLEGRKLFGPHPTKISEDNKYDFELMRYMRAAAGEGGKVDRAAQIETQKHKTFHYRGLHESAGLVETDGMPPISIDKLALMASLQFASILQSKISPVIQVMRKTVADGSNTTGFQRTALVARGGQLETSEGVVRIDNISIEEDSCRTLENHPDKKIYHLDRLGIPLIEVGTAPDIKSPTHCLETVKKLGEILRSLPNCRRGLGTIRQDVNVSIKEGERVEIKGAQDLKMVPDLVRMEATRQHELIELRTDLREQKIQLPNTLEITDLTTLLAESESKVLKTNKAKGGVIKAIKLAGWGGLIGRELAPSYRVGTELAGRAKVHAGVGGLFHSDEMPNYGVTAEEVAKINTKLKCKTDDAFILVADQEHRVTKALDAIHQRLKEFYCGVPSEVRKAHPDGTSRFLRPMPGAARMYPETDVPLIFAREQGEILLPELLSEKIQRFQTEYKLTKDLANHTVKSTKANLFEELAKEHSKIKAAFIAETIGPTLIELKRKEDIAVENITGEKLRELFLYLAEGKLNKDNMLQALKDTADGSFSLDKFKGIDAKELESIIANILQDNQGAPFGALMGKAMAELKGKASGQEISAMIKKLQS